MDWMKSKGHCRWDTTLFILKFFGQTELFFIGSWSVYWQESLDSVYTNAISKLTRSINCRIRSSISFFLISFRRSGPNFSTQKEAIADPTMMAVFIFSKEMSFVCAI